MGQKRRITIRLIVFGIVFMLFGCSEDLFDEQIDKSNIKIQRVSMNDSKFKENRKLMISVDELLKNQSNNALNRYEYDSVYNFFIDKENGIYIEKDSLDSYTFSVYKNETDSLVTNIVFNKNADGEYDVILAKYDLLKTDLESLTKSELDNTEIEYTSLQGKFGISEPICIDVQEWQYSLEYIPGQGYSYVGDWYTISSYCASESGGGGGDGLGDGIGSSGNTGGGILTSPVDSNHGGGGSSQETFPDTPCGRIKKGTSSNEYRRRFKDLDTETNHDLTYETGFGEKIVNGVRHYVDAIPSTASMNIPIGSVSFTHVHNNDMKTDAYGNPYNVNVKILSPKDLLQLMINCSNNALTAGISPLDSNGIMISDEGIFALTITDTNINLSTLTPLWPKFVKDYYDISSKILLDPSLTGDGRKTKLQKMLLGLLKEIGLQDKIGLFEGEVEIEPGQLPKINWTKKTLNSSGVIEDTPC